MMKIWGNEGRKGRDEAVMHVVDQVVWGEKSGRGEGEVQAKLER